MHIELTFLLNRRFIKVTLFLENLFHFPLDILPNCLSVHYAVFNFSLRTIAQFVNPYLLPETDVLESCRSSVLNCIIVFYTCILRKNMLS